MFETKVIRVHHLEIDKYGFGGAAASVIDVQKELGIICYQQVAKCDDDRVYGVGSNP